MQLHKFLNSPESIQNAYLYNKKAPRGSRHNQARTNRQANRKDIVTRFAIVLAAGATLAAMYLIRSA